MVVMELFVGEVFVYFIVFFLGDDFDVCLVCDLVCQVFIWEVENLVDVQ